MHLCYRELLTVNVRLKKIFVLKVKIYKTKIFLNFCSKLNDTYIYKYKCIRIHAHLTSFEFLNSLELPGAAFLVPSTLCWFYLSSNFNLLLILIIKDISSIIRIN